MQFKRMDLRVFDMEGGDLTVPPKPLQCRTRRYSSQYLFSLEIAPDQNHGWFPTTVDF